LGNEIYNYLFCDIIPQNTKIKKDSHRPRNIEKFNDKRPAFHEFLKEALQRKRKCSVRNPDFH
jgi:hypothetical protein